MQAHALAGHLGALQARGQWGGGKGGRCIRCDRQRGGRPREAAGGSRGAPAPTRPAPPRVSTALVGGSLATAPQPPHLHGQDALLVLLRPAVEEQHLGDRAVSPRKGEDRGGAVAAPHQLPRAQLLAVPACETGAGRGRGVVGGPADRGCVCGWVGGSARGGTKCHAHSTLDMAGGAVPSTTQGHKRVPTVCLTPDVSFPPGRCQAECFQLAWHQQR